MNDRPDVFTELSPPYSTIVADPPWPYDAVNPPSPRYVVDGQVIASGIHAAGSGLGYSSMSLDQIKALPVGDLASDTRCFLWVTQRYLHDGPNVLRAWGEAWCPGPYLELFCRRPRLGWDSWGKGYEIGAAS